MKQGFFHRSQKKGLPAGSLIYIGNKQPQETKFSIINYGENYADIKESTTIEECLKPRKKNTITWINVTGLNDTKNIALLCENYGVNSLVIEDIFNTEQHPKVDFTEEYIFLILKSYNYNLQQKNFGLEQVSIIVGKDFVLTIQETSNNVFGSIKDRIKILQTPIHSKGADYLAYALIDVIVDGYFEVAEEIGNEIEVLEEKITGNPDNKIVKEMHGIKRELIYLRKSVWPLRDIINSLHHGAGNLIKNETFPYLKDVYDHTIQIIDTVETYRDFLASILDIYLSSVSYRLNEVMKVLTIFASIFIPLTFITSLYGMNFNTSISHFNMPELSWRYGYLFVLGILFAVAITMLIFFKRKKWL